MSFDWYHRDGVTPWLMSACETHGAELVAVGFWCDVTARRAADAMGLAMADKCALCNGTLSLAEVRACRCNVRGIPCPVHAPKPAGVTGQWSRVRCTKCGAELQLPADRIAFEPSIVGDGCVGDDRIAINITDEIELQCPFHAGDRYPLEYVDDEQLDDEQLDAEVDEDGTASPAATALDR